MTLDGARITAASLSRDWGIPVSRITSSYRRHHPATREALRAAIQADLVQVTVRQPPHGGTLIWSAKSGGPAGRPRKPTVAMLRARLVELGVNLPEY